MLQSRIIPCLLVQNNELVKTIEFANPKYIGDPINAVRIFNEKESDELIVLDISSDRCLRPPNYNLIENLANECRMPLCFGGGISDLSQVEKIISLGVEKVAIGAAFENNPNLIKDLSDKFGRQSIVGIMNISRQGLNQIPKLISQRNLALDFMEPVGYAKFLQENGVGEILINLIDRDGRMSGYDLDVIQEIYDVVSLPVSVVGGAAGLNDVKALFSRFGLIGAAGGSMFVFKGKYKAVLIQYPDAEERESAQFFAS